jgi:uncharacterized membrane protein YsdA (DUF1294 family)
VWLAIAFLLVSLIGFAAMGADKSRARRNQWRIPERTLLLLAAIGGAAGILLGMRVFRHKTRHPRFTVTVPLLLFLQAVVLTLALVG